MKNLLMEATKTVPLFNPAGRAMTRALILLPLWFWWIHYRSSNQSMAMFVGMIILIPLMIVTPYVYRLVAPSVTTLALLMVNGILGIFFGMAIWGNEGMLIGLLMAADEHDRGFHLLTQLFFVALFVPVFMAGALLAEQSISEQARKGALFAERAADLLQAGCVGQRARASVKRWLTEREEE